MSKAYPLPINADSLEMLVRATETFVAKVYPDAVIVARRNAAWRKQPVTSNQLKVLGRVFKAPESTSEPDSESFVEENVHLMHLTKGEAANLITLIREGGLRAYRDTVRSTEKAMKIEAKKQAQMVKVGPLEI